MRYFVYFSALIYAVLLTCSPSPVELAGGSTSTPNEIITGHVVFPDGTPASRTEVQLIHSSYSVVGSHSSTLPTDTTDAAGAYRFTNVDTGTYNIQALHLDTRTRSLIAGIAADADTVRVLPTVLEPPGNLVVILSESPDLANSYLLIPGTTIASYSDGTRDTLVLDSVPAGRIPEIAYSSVTDTAAVTIRYDVRVPSGDTAVVRNSSWKYARTLGLNTSAAGADVTGTLTDFPVLIRLNADNFNFTQARTQGADIRFTQSDNEFLDYEIERWDSARRRAAIWVRVDTVFGNDSTQSLTMFWGNPGVSSQSSGSAVFDTANGFQGVWHLDETVENSFHDATFNNYDGISPDTAVPTAAEGMIGNAMVFNGTTDFITMPNTSDSKLNFPQESHYTVSAWVFADTLDHTSHLIVAKGYQQYFLRLTYFPSDSPLWEFVEFNETVDWQTSTCPATGRQWTLLTGVRQGNSQFLYCNGMLVDSTMDVWTNDLDRDTTEDLSIGTFLKEIPALDIPTNDGYCYFKGSIDEVRIHNRAQSPDWIRLCYMNQRADDRLVTFK